MLAAKTVLPTLISPNPPKHRPGNSNDNFLHFSKKNKPFITIPKAKNRHHKIITCLKSSSSESTNVNAIDKNVVPAQNRAAILSEALPFIQKFRGKTIVVKYGGAAMKSKALQASVIDDIVRLSYGGIRVVLVHGGGPEINRCLEIHGIKPKFINGLRVTDASTMDIVSKALDDLNKQLVDLTCGIGVGFSNGCLLTARPSPHAAELGFVGEIDNVDVTMLQDCIDKNHIPMIASVATDSVGQCYNINADTVAGEIAAALGSEKLILLTDVAGILENRDNPEESLVKEIDVNGVKNMIDEGKIAGGMIPKVNCCVRSIARGVRTASIIDGRLKHSLLLEVLTDEGVGTMITG